MFSRKVSTKVWFGWTLPLALLFLWGAAATPGVARAASGQSFSDRVGNKTSELKKSRQRKAGLRGKLDALARDYQHAEEAHNDTVSKIRLTRGKLRTTERRLAANRAQLAHRLDGVYRNGSVEIGTVLLGATSFQDFLTRLDYLTRLGAADARLVSDSTRLRHRLGEAKVRLRRESSTERIQLSGMKKSAAQLDGALEAESSRETSLQSQIAALEREERLAVLRRQRERLERIRAERRRLEALRNEREQRRLAADTRFSTRRGPGAGKATRATYGAVFSRGGYAFPVAGSYGYADTWGAPRSGGRRHKGTDIFARYGTPLVAVTGGTVRQKTSGLGGITVWLSGNDGNCYYYAHMSGWGKGGRVGAGATVGYVGTSGNARGTPPHVHFEIHPGCGGAVNPYPTLKRWE